MCVCVSECVEVFMRVCSLCDIFHTHVQNTHFCMHIYLPN